MDSLSPVQRSARMSRVRGKNTGPELAVRSLVHSLGYRFRLHRRDLPGTPDLVFPSRRKVILVHGCFWHRHPDPDCKLARMPKSRQEFWRPKLEGNRARDLRDEAALRAAGWEVMTVWECQLRDRASLANEIGTFLRA
ncbi:MAG: DNA mismatch endonuclease Vsr [Brevundimonas sp.]|uniref:very short patch repair endonuclease n=1 Tax=Brevundimonas sp. TaxID=1871086 RepID=UPI0025C3388A|nr:very short patch repair endonuclease [Brevundimonas sp.]MBX3478363.1 DNA mismatch endonuclease Vsr [Brevundimonas sp.]